MRKMAFIVLVLSASAFAQNVTCYANPSTSSSGTAIISSNGTGSYNVSLSAWQLSVPCLTSKVTYSVKRLDTAGATYDIGLYCVDGNCNHTCGSGSDACLYAHLGALPAATFAPALGSVTKTWILVTCGNPCTLPSGLYAVSVGTNCTMTAKCAELAMDDPNGGQIMAFDLISAGGMSYGAGGLPAFVPVPPIVPQIATTSNNLPGMLQLLIF